MGGGADNGVSDSTNPVEENPNWPIGFWLTDNRHNDDHPPQTIYRNYP